MMRAGAAALLWGALWAGAEGVDFCDGPALASLVWENRCTPTTYQLAEAEAECNGNPTCTVIHNVNCDSQWTWRICPGQSIPSLLAASATQGDQGGCSRVSITVGCGSTTTAVPEEALLGTTGGEKMDGEAYAATVSTSYMPVVVGTFQFTVAEQTANFTADGGARGAIVSALSRTFGLSDSQVAISVAAPGGARRLRRLFLGGVVDFALSLEDALVAPVQSAMSQSAEALTEALTSTLDSVGLGSASGSVEVDSISVESAHVYAPLYEAAQTTCAATFQIRESHGEAVDSCRSLCDLDASCQFYFSDSGSNCFTFSGCTATRSVDPAGTTFQKARLREEPASWIVSGPCEVQGECASSPNYPSSYGSRQSCTLEAPVGYGVASTVATERYFDLVTINGESISGDTAVGAIKPTTALLWTSDYSVTDGGFQVCLVPPTTTATTTSTATATVASTTATALRDLVTATSGVDTTDVGTTTGNDAAAGAGAGAAGGDSGSDDFDLLSLLRSDPALLGILAGAAALCLLCACGSAACLCVRRRKRAQGREPLRRPEPPGPKFKVGDRVEAKYVNDRWYSAVVREVRKKRQASGAAYVYTIDWDDNDQRERVKDEEHIRHVVEDIPSRKPEWLTRAEALWAGHLASWRAHGPAADLGGGAAPPWPSRRRWRARGPAADGVPAASRWPSPEHIDTEEAKASLRRLRELRWGAQEAVWSRALQACQAALDSPADPSARTIDPGAKDDRQLLAAADGASLALLQLAGFQSVGSGKAARLRLPGPPDGRCSKMFHVLLTEASDSWWRHSREHPDHPEPPGLEPPEDDRPPELDSPRPFLGALATVDADLPKVVSIVGFAGCFVDRIEFQLGNGQQRVYDSGCSRRTETTLCFNEAEALVAVEQVASLAGFGARLTFHTSAGSSFELRGSACEGDGRRQLVEAPKGEMVVGLKFDSRRVLRGVVSAPWRGTAAEPRGVRMAHRPRVCRKPFSVGSALKAGCGQQVPPALDSVPAAPDAARCRGQPKPQQEIKEASASATSTCSTRASRRSTKKEWRQKKANKIASSAGHLPLAVLDQGGDAAEPADGWALSALQSKGVVPRVEVPPESHVPEQQLDLGN